MKVALLSESPADEAALRVLVEAVLGRAVDAVRPPSRRPGGVGGVFGILEPTLRWLHYHREAEGLVVLVDSNDSPIHAAALDEPCRRADRCRYCRLRRAIEDVRRDLARVPSGAPILTAIGLAVPAVEGWYLCGKRPNISEAAWVRGMEEGRVPYTRSRLKEWTYGTDRPSLRLETDRAVAEMRRVVQDLDLLERRFPVGFGALRADLRAWASPNAHR